MSVTDTLPAGVTFVSAAGSGWACVNNASISVTCTRALLAVGPAPVITVVVTAPAQPSTLTNSATVTSPTPDPDPTDNTSTVTTSVGPNADLSLVKTGPATVTAGGSVTYSLVVANAGPSDAVGVSVTDTLPAGGHVRLRGRTGWTCVNAGDVSVTCTTALIVSGVPAPPITVIVTAPVQAGTLTNTATVTATTPDPDPSNDTGTADTSVTGIADLSMTKTGPATVTSGGSVSYSLVVANAGPSDAANVTVTDTLPAGVTYGSAAGSGWSCTPRGQRLRDLHAREHRRRQPGAGDHDRGDRPSRRGDPVQQCHRDVSDLGSRPDQQHRNGHHHCRSGSGPVPREDRTSDRRGRGDGHLHADRVQRRTRRRRRGPDHRCASARGHVRVGHGFGLVVQQRRQRLGDVHPGRDRDGNLRAGHHARRSCAEHDRHPRQPRERVRGDVRPGRQQQRGRRLDRSCCRRARAPAGGSRTPAATARTSSASGSCSSWSVQASEASGDAPTPDESDQLDRTTQASRLTGPCATGTIAPMDEPSESPAPPDEALTRALTALVTQGVLTSDQADQVSTTRAEQAAQLSREQPSAREAGEPASTARDMRPGAGSRLPEVLGYLGGTFVVAAAVLVVGLSWDSFDRETKLLVTALSAVVVYGAGLAIALGAAGGRATLRRPEQDIRRRLVGVLLVVGSFLAAGVVALFFEDSIELVLLPIARPPGPHRGGRMAGAGRRADARPVHRIGDARGFTGEPVQRPRGPHLGARLPGAGAGVGRGRAAAHRHPDRRVGRGTGGPRRHRVGGLGAHGLPGRRAGERRRPSGASNWWHRWASGCSQCSRSSA